MIFESLCPHTPNFNVDTEFLMGLCPVTFVEITSQISEQSAANIEISGEGAAWSMLSHSNAGVQKKAVLSQSCFFAKLFRSTAHFCEVISAEVTRGPHTAHHTP